MKKLIDILPKITQWEAIPYVADLMCKDCGMSGFSESGIRKPNLVGWCETDYAGKFEFEMNKSYIQNLIYLIIGMLHTKDLDFSKLEE